MSLAFHDAGLTLQGKPVLSGLNFRLDDGAQVALIGPSGAGKTSLLMLANTLARPTQGTVEPLGQNPWRLRPGPLAALRARIGTVYQTPPLPARQRVVNAVAAGRLASQSVWGSLLALLRPHDPVGVSEALRRVDLADRIWDRCDRLSGGQRQRVGIARVLYQAPRLMLADEPVSALDPRLAEDTVRLLSADARARGATLMMSLHSVDLALAYFPRIIGLRAGRVAFDLPRAAVTSELIAQLYAGEETAPAPALEPGPSALPRSAQC